MARKYEIMPLVKVGKELIVAIADPWNLPAFEAVRAKTGLTAKPVIATESEIREAINRHYGKRGSLEETIKSVESEKVGIEKLGESDPKKLEDMAGERSSQAYGDIGPQG